MFWFFLWMTICTALSHEGRWQPDKARRVLQVTPLQALFNPSGLD